MSFLFFTRPSLAEVQEIVASLSGVTILDVFQMSYAEWHGGQIDSFAVGPFTYRPIWQRDKGQKGASEIVFDPGVVFGSGWHVTTSCCLEALDLVFQQESIHSALDLGTGSGLLALATARYGCQRVLAVDLNPLAVTTTRANIRANDLEARILPCQARAEDCIGASADLVMANIHYEVLHKLVNASEFYEKRWFIVSGIMRSHYFELLEHFKKRPVALVKIWDEGQVWYTVLGQILS
jgi:ribosomal protein L11 methyltransferase